MDVKCALILGTIDESFADRDLFFYQVFVNVKKGLEGKYCSGPD